MTTPSRGAGSQRPTAPRGLEAPEGRDTPPRGRGAQHRADRAKRSGAREGGGGGGVKCSKIKWAESSWVKILPVFMYYLKKSSLNDCHPGIMSKTTVTDRVTVIHGAGKRVGEMIVQGECRPWSLIPSCRPYAPIGIRDRASTSSHSKRVPASTPLFTRREDRVVRLDRSGSLHPSSLYPKVVDAHGMGVHATAL